MTFTIQTKSLDELADIYKDSRQKLRWPIPFVLPAWMRVWWESFGAGNEMFIRTVLEDNKIIGIAPLMKKDNTAYFIGSTDVCDYQDFIVAGGKEKDFFTALLEDLKNKYVNVLDLKHVRPDSLVLKNLAAIAEEKKPSWQSQNQHRRPSRSLRALLRPLLF